MREKLAALGPILLLTFGHGAVDSYVGLLAALTPGLAAYLNVPIGNIVMLVGVAALVNNSAQPLTGWVMQRRNMTWALCASVLLSTLPVLMGYVPNFWWLCVIIILGSIGTGVYHPEGVLSAHDATGDKAYLGIPLFMAGGVAIYSAMIPLSIWMSERFGFRSLVWLAIPGLLVSLIMFLAYRQKRRQHPSIVMRPRSRRVTKVRTGVMSFWPLLVVGLFFCIGSGLFMSIVTSHYELRFGEVSRHDAGYVLMVLGVLTSAASFGWSWLSKRHSFYFLALISQVLAVPLFFLMARLPSPGLGVALAAPLALVTPAALHPVGVMLARNAAGLSQSMRTSLMLGGTYGASAVAVMVAGVLLDRGIGSEWLVIFCGLCSLGAAVVAGWQVLRHGRRVEVAEG